MTLLSRKYNVAYIERIWFTPFSYLTLFISRYSRTVRSTCVPPSTLLTCRTTWRPYSTHSFRLSSTSTASIFLRRARWTTAFLMKSPRSVVQGFLCVVGMFFWLRGFYSGRSGLQKLQKVLKAKHNCENTRQRCWEFGAIWLIPNVSFWLGRQWRKTLLKCARTTRRAFRPRTCTGC